MRGLKQDERQRSWFAQNKSPFLYHYADPDSVQLLSEDDRSSITTDIDPEKSQNESVFAKYVKRFNIAALIKQNKEETTTCDADTQYPPEDHGQVKLFKMMGLGSLSSQGNDNRSIVNKGQTVRSGGEKPESFILPYAFRGANKELQTKVDRSATFIFFALILTITMIFTLALFFMASDSGLKPLVTHLLNNDDQKLFPSTVYSSSDQTLLTRLSTDDEQNDTMEQKERKSIVDEQQQVHPRMIHNHKLESIMRSDANDEQQQQQSLDQIQDGEVIVSEPVIDLVEDQTIRQDEVNVQQQE